MTARLTERLERLIRYAIDKDASGLVLMPDEPPAIRVRGDLERLEEDALSSDELRKMAITAVGEDAVKRLGSEIGSIQQWCGAPGEYNASISVAKTRGECSICVHTSSAYLPTVDVVGLPSAMLAACDARAGLIITSGSMGTGKTTVAYALIEYLNANREGCNICTIEEPIHVHIPSKKAFLQQREVGIDCPDVLSGVQSALYQDVDVIFVGEVLDVDVLLACIRMAELGKLVITQMHEATPEDAIRRILDSLPVDGERMYRRSVSRVLRAVSAQRLHHRKDGKGRVAAYGILIPDNEMRDAIAEGRDFTKRDTPWPASYQTIEQHETELRNSGIIA